MTDTNSPDASATYATIGTSKLHYERIGTGFPVILLHAGIADARQWDGQMEALSAAFTVIRYDLRGFGKSDRPTAPYSDVSDLNALMLELNLEKAHLIGLASGASVALNFALKHPEKVAGLILASPLLSGFTNYSRQVLQVVMDIETAAGRGDKMTAVELTLRLWVDGFARAIDGIDLLTRMRIQRLLSDNAQVLNAPDLEVRPTIPASERLAELKASTLILVGEKDLDDIHKIADTLLQGIPAHVQRLIIPESGHMINMEHPEEFNNIVLNFLKDLSKDLPTDPATDAPTGLRA